MDDLMARGWPVVIWEIRSADPTLTVILTITVPFEIYGELWYEITEIGLISKLTIR
jgi:hypothetical protein